MTFLAPAIGDLSDALRRFHLWVALGNIEIKQRYKRSFLGPFWITINMGILIFGIGYIYAYVFQSLHSSYIPFLATGILAWNLIGGSLGDGANCFISAGSVIKNITISKLVHLFHGMWRNVIIGLHNGLIMVPVYLIYGGFPGWGILAVIPGAIVLVLFLVSASLLLALLSARYRDVPPAIAGFLQLAFFATPIIWEADTLSHHRWIVTLNPFFHMVECIRAPLLHGTLPLTSIAVTGSLAILVGWVALIAYSKVRRRIVYWL